MCLIHIFSRSLYLATFQNEDRLHPGEIEYTLNKSDKDVASQNTARAGLKATLRIMTSISAISVPEGMTVSDMERRDVERAIAEAAAVAASTSAGTTNSPEVDDVSEESVREAVASKWGKGPVSADKRVEAKGKGSARSQSQGQTQKSDNHGAAAPTSGSKVSWKQPDARIMDLRKEAKESGKEYERVKKGYKEGLYAWSKV